MNKTDLIEFAKKYLNVQEVPSHIAILLEGMVDANHGRILSSTSRQSGRTTANRIYLAYTSSDRMETVKNQNGSTIPINTTNGEYGEK